MSPTTRLVLTLVIVAVTLAALALKPRRVSEAWVVLPGASLLLALGLVTPRQALAAAEIGKEALLFLIALVLLSRLVDRSGAFSWAALHAARGARGDGLTLFRNVFVLGSLVTIVLSLDTTAVILTPILLALVDRLGLPAKPYLITCAFVANTASAILPISNLTNLLVVRELSLPMGAYVARMALPQAVALGLTYVLLRRIFRADLAQPFDHGTLEEPSAVIEHPTFFRAACAVLVLTLLGFFAGPMLGLAPYVVGFAGVAALGGVGLATGRTRARELVRAPWSLVVFVLSLFVLVQAVENLGLGLLAQKLSGSASSLGVLLLGTTAAALLANICNNLPATLLAISILQQASTPALAYGTLLGVNIGPNLLPTASLATMLVLSAARERGVIVTFRDVVGVGLRTTPIVLVSAVLTLAATYVLKP